MGNMICYVEYPARLHYDGCDTKSPPVLALKG
jgi:hypothetical protein